MREPTREERTVVTAIIEEAGPSLGVPAQRACYPATSRCVLTYLVRSYRQQFQAEHRQVVETLHWQRPGTVWAIDHSEIVGVQVRQTLARQAVLQQGMY